MARESDPCPKCGGETRAEVLPEYADNLLGLPVALRGAVVWETCEACGETATEIPDMDGLTAALAVTRALYPRQLTGAELRFLRKAIGMQAKDFAAAIGGTEDDLAGWEGGSEPISVESDLKARALTCDKLHRAAPAIPSARIFSDRLRRNQFRARKRGEPFRPVMERVEIKAPGESRPRLRWTTDTVTRRVQGERARGQKDEALRRKLKPLVAEALNKRDGRKAGDGLPPVDEHTAGWLMACGVTPGTGNEIDIADKIIEEILTAVSHASEHRSTSDYYSECREMRDKFRRLKGDLKRAYRNLTTGGEAFPGKEEAVRALRASYRVACHHEAMAIMRGERDEHYENEDCENANSLGPKPDEVRKYYKRVIAKAVTEALASQGIEVSRTKGNESGNSSSIAIRMMNAIWSDAHASATDQSWIGILKDPNQASCS